VSEQRPDAEHPTDHEPFWLFLRQERREAEVIVDVFYCARCLGRVEVLATGTPALPDRRPVRGPLLTLGAAAREA
jgi:hypothetical protein